MLTFTQIPGLEEVKESLIRSFMESRVAQTQLFINGDGGAGMALAHAYAKQIACHNPHDLDCNKCASCKMFLSGNYPDLLYIFPFIKSASSKNNKSCSLDYELDFKTSFAQNPFLTVAEWHDYIESGNKQFSIPVSEADYINKIISTKPLLPSPRFIFIWLPETLTTEAANKLLKTLEEPGKGNYFFLITIKPEKILPTIVSRCVTLRIPSNTELDAMEFLLTRGLSEEHSKNRALSSNGNIGLALSSIIREGITNEYLEGLIIWLRLIYSRNVDLLVGWCDSMSKLNRVDLIAFLKITSQLLQRALQIQVKTSTSTIILGNFDLQQFSQYLHLERGPEIVDTLDKAISDVERNANSKTVLLDLSLRFFKYIG